MTNVSNIEITNKIFFDNNDISKSKISSIINDTLLKCDDGEIFLENSNNETFFFDDGRMKNVSYNNSQGFGIRSILGEIRGYAHSGTINEKSIVKAAKTVESISKNKGGITKIPSSNIVNEPFDSLI